MNETEKTPHLVDMGEPEETWPGYWCPVDQSFHKDGTTLLHNLHCIACKTMLKRQFPARDGKPAFTVNG
jgi:hypothetical protein